MRTHQPPKAEPIDKLHTNDLTESCRPGERGRIVFTASIGLLCVGSSRTEWGAIQDMQSGRVNRCVPDSPLPTGPLERVIEYTAPFTLQNRETDYATVWARPDERKG